MMYCGGTRHLVNGAPNTEENRASGSFGVSVGNHTDLRDVTQYNWYMLMIICIYFTNFTHGIQIFTFVSFSSVAKD